MMARLATVLFCVLLTPHAVQAVDVASLTIPARASGALPARSSNQLQEELEVWIDLSVPPLSTLSGANLEARDALRTRITKQQDEVMSHLAPLGAEELARVVQVRNAIAVRIPSSQLTQARAIPGVVKVRVVKHRKRMP